jgi:WD40-like Beta Propeller Repeat
MRVGNKHNRSGPLWRTAAALLLAVATLPAAAAAAGAAPALPPGMSFVAQDAAGVWGLYRVDGQRAVQRVATQLEPRQACVAPDGSKAVYAAADGTVRALAVAAGQEAVLARSDAKRSYTQPCLSADGREVYVVEMADGKSLETEILRYTSGSAEPARIARQPGAQHDPFVHQGRWLVYASVGCSDGCEELLVEIWSRDLLAGKARQLTLLNALSQGPVTDGRRVVFSSNASGTHQLWQVGLDGSGQRRLTDGLAQAVHPALCAGAVHFVRAGPAGAAIARLGEDGSVTELPAPGLKNFRALRCL